MTSLYAQNNAERVRLLGAKCDSIGKALADMRYNFIENVCAECVTRAKESKEHRRSVQPIRISFGIFSVQIAVQHKTHSPYQFRFLKRICNRFICFAEITVIIAPYSAIQAIEQIGAIAIIAGKLCRLR